MLRPTRAHFVTIWIYSLFFFVWNPFTTHTVSLDYPSLCPHKTWFWCTSNSFSSSKLKTAARVAEEQHFWRVKFVMACRLKLTNVTIQLYFCVSTAEAHTHGMHSHRLIHFSYNFITSTAIKADFISAHSHLHRKVGIHIRRNTNGGPLNISPLILCHPWKL